MNWSALTITRMVVIVTQLHQLNRKKGEAIEGSYHACKSIASGEGGAEKGRERREREGNGKTDFGTPYHLQYSSTPHP